MQKHPFEGCFYSVLKKTETNLSFIKESDIPQYSYAFQRAHAQSSSFAALSAVYRSTR